MSRFGDAMGHGLASLIHETGETVLYWPAGEEADEIEIQGIFTAMRGMEAEDGSMRSDIRRGEVQIYADATLGVETVDLRNDIVIIDGAQWRVTEVFETVAGMHRLQVEWSDRAVARRSRGRW